jgi:hypothetical protein
MTACNVRQGRKTEDREYHIHTYLLTYKHIYIHIKEDAMGMGM